MQEPYGMDCFFEPLLQPGTGRCSAALLGFAKGEEREEPLLEAGFREGEALEAASLGKVFLLGAFLERVQTGKADPWKRITWDAGKSVSGSGVLADLTGPVTMCLRDLALLMVSVSDNTATNLLLEEAGGAEAVREHLERCGITDCALNRPILTEAGLALHPEWKDLPFSKASAASVCRYLLSALRGELFDCERTRDFLEILGKQQDLSMFPADLPAARFLDEEREEEIRVCSKTGFDGGTRADAGILYGRDRTLVYCVIANGSADTEYRWNNRTHRAFARTGYLAWEELGKRVHQKKQA